MNARPTVGFLLLVLVAALAVPARAGRVQLRLRGGIVLTGRILEASFDRVKLRIAGTRGFVEVAIGALTPGGVQPVYDHLAARSPRTRAGRLALAGFCRRHGLFLFARQELRLAASLDPGSKPVVEREMAAVDLAHARTLHSEALDALGRDDLAGALALLDRVVREFPASPHARRAARLVGPLRQKLARQARLRQQALAAARPPARPRVDRWLVGRLRLVDLEVARARKLVEAGYRYEGDGNPGVARRSYLEARSAFEKALGMIEGIEAYLARKKRSDPTVSARKTTAAGGLVRVLLNLAHYYAGTRQLHQARRFVNLVLARDPQHAEALELRTRITVELMRQKVSGGSK